MSAGNTGAVMQRLRSCLERLTVSIVLPWRQFFQIPRARLPCSWMWAPTLIAKRGTSSSLP